MKAAPITQFVPLPRTKNSVQRQMRWVLIALLPALGVSMWFFGISVLINLGLTTLTGLGVEAGINALRHKPPLRSLKDGSALVTAWLISLSALPILPWWTVIIITAFAMLIKHLYGGLGQNPFNPAMAALCFLLITFPSQANRWQLMLSQPTTSQQLTFIFGTDAEIQETVETSSQSTAEPLMDAMASATPLSLLKPTQLTETTQPFVRPFYINQILTHYANLPLSIAFLIGGLILIQQKVIRWRLPLTFLGTIAIVSTLFWLANDTVYAPPYFHLIAGGTMIGAFFIITDPVTSPTTSKAQLLFAIGAGLMVCLIRAFGPYPDGVAFSVLLMNLAAPLLDRLTQPKPFGSDA